MARGRPSKKSVILDIAQHLFAKQGYQGTSIDLVVREAQVSKPTVYNNFPSKQVLIQSLIERKIESKQQYYADLLQSPDDFSDIAFNLFNSITSDPFELAIFKMFYGESHKLDHQTILLCQTFESQLLDCMNLLCEQQKYPPAQQFIISSVYKNAVILNTLSNKTILSRAELKLYLKVLGTTPLENVI
jgi:AcrR family transcriptional regulator